MHHDGVVEDTVLSGLSCDDAYTAGVVIGRRACVSGLIYLCMPVVVTLSVVEYMVAGQYTYVGVSFNLDRRNPPENITRR